MDYISAIEKLIKDHNLGIFDNPFLTYSILSDEVESNIYDVRLAKVLYLCLSNIKVIQILKKEGLTSGRECLKNEYFNSLKDQCTKKEFVDAINPISAVMFPGEYKSKVPATNKGVAVAVKKVSQKVKVNHAPVIINTNKPIKPNKPVAKKQQANNQQQSFHKISINVKALTLELTVSSNGKFKAIVDGVDTKLDLNKYIFNDTLILNINAPYKTLQIKLPKKVYDSIEINANNTFIYSFNDYSQKIARYVTIHNNIGGVSFGFNAEDISIDINSGDLTLYGSYKNINATINNGSAEYILGNSYNDIYITTKVNSGKIKCSFNYGKCNPALTSFFHHPKTICAQTMVGNSKIHFDLKVNNGKITIK